jgi:endonuclease/exonuclease/phosphatase family metal-dependent hydrolase
MNIKTAFIAFLLLFPAGISGKHSISRVDRLETDLTDQSSEVLVAEEKKTRIGTWNVKRLGNGSKRYDLLAKTIDENMDVVALQEIMKPGSLANIMDLLPGWTYRISGRVGRSGYFEHYAILIRKNFGSFTDSYVINDSEDDWAREPFLACMLINRSEICLLTIHVIFGDSTKARDKEIKKLLDQSLILKKRNPGRGLIVLGDFNRPGRAKVFDDLHGSNFFMVDSGTVKTTLGLVSYVNPYDHIIADSNTVLKKNNEAFMFDIVDKMCNKNFKWCSEKVSDHAPVIFDLNL